MPRPALPRCCHAACPPLQSSPDPRENRVGGWAKKCARCCGCGPSLRFRSVSLLRVQKESMKAMRGLVSLGECCFSSSRSLPLIASPRLRRLQHHAPLGSPRAPRPPGISWVLQEPPPAGRASPVERGGAGSRGSGRLLHGLLLLGGMARAARASMHGARGRSPDLHAGAFPPRNPPLSSDLMHPCAPGNPATARGAPLTGSAAGLLPQPLLLLQPYGTNGFPLNSHCHSCLRSWPCGP